MDNKGIQVQIKQEKSIRHYELPYAKMFKHLDKMEKSQKNIKLFKKKLKNCTVLKLF